MLFFMAARWSLPQIVPRFLRLFFMRSGGAQHCAGPKRRRHLEEHVTASSRRSFTWIQWCGGPVSADKVCVVVLPSLEWLDGAWKDSAVGHPQV